MRDERGDVSDKSISGYWQGSIYSSSAFISLRGSQVRKVILSVFFFTCTRQSRSKKKRRQLIQLRRTLLWHQCGDAMSGGSRSKSCESRLFVKDHHVGNLSDSRKEKTFGIFNFLFYDNNSKCSQDMNAAPVFGQGSRQTHLWIIGHCQEFKAWFGVGFKEGQCIDLQEIFGWNSSVFFFQFFSNRWMSI